MSIEASIREAVFSPSEFTARQNAVRAAAQKAGFDALLIVDPANLYYLIGYDAWSFYVPQALYFPVEGEPYFITREMDANGAHRTATAIRRENILGYPETLIQREHEHPAQWMAATLSDLGAGKAQRVGYEENASFFTIRTFTTLAQALPEWELAPSQNLVNWVRLVKSDAEIALMRRAGQVCTAAMNAAFDGLQPDRALNEVAAEILAAQARGAGDVDGDYPAIVPLFPMGAGADTPHLTWSNMPIPEGEPVSVELTGVHHRYHAPLARTAIVGAPDRKLADLAEVTVEALNTALQQVKAGALAQEPAQAFNAVLSKHGYTKNSRLGYPIGIGFPPDWGEQTASIRGDDKTVLQPNMAFHVIAGMWLAGSGFEVSESVYVTETGCQTLCDVPRQLIQLESGRK